jgi:hypothetical protein
MTMGRPPARLRLGAALLAFWAAEGPAAARHAQGYLTVSLGGSLAHTVNEHEDSELSYEWDGREFQTIETPRRETYNDVDAMLSLSVGYFVLDRLEIGLSGSALATWYTATNRDDYGIFDAKLYARRFFDNRTSLTPYLKAEAGTSRLRTGDYRESDASVGAALGLEFFGSGSMSYFAELSTEHRNLGGDLKGSEWEQRIYVGITWYLDLLKRRRAGPLPPTLDARTRRRIEKAERHWSRALESLDRQIEDSLPAP